MLLSVFYWFYYVWISLTFTGIFKSSQLRDRATECRRECPSHEARGPFFAWRQRHRECSEAYREQTSRLQLVPHIFHSGTIWLDHYLCKNTGIVTAVIDLHVLWWCTLNIHISLKSALLFTIRGSLFAAELQLEVHMMTHTPCVCADIAARAVSLRCQWGQVLQRCSGDQWAGLRTSDGEDRLSCAEAGCLPPAQREAASWSWTSWSQQQGSCD